MGCGGCCGFGLVIFSIFLALGLSFHVGCVIGCLVEFLYVYDFRQCCFFFCWFIRFFLG